MHPNRNPGYTGSYSTSGTCTWTLAKCSQDVCLIRSGEQWRLDHLDQPSHFCPYRLDFEELTTRAPTTQGICTPDYFQATGAATGTTQGSTGNLSPKICGVNTGKNTLMK